MNVEGGSRRMSSGEMRPPRQLIVSECAWFARDRGGFLKGASRLRAFVSSGPGDRPTAALWRRRWFCTRRSTTRSPQSGYSGIR